MPSDKIMRAIQTMEIERLQSLLRAKDAQLDKLREASFRDPRCYCCGYPVAESLRRICITCSKYVSVGEDNTVVITNFEEAEKTLMCGSCVMVRTEHAGHDTQPYLNIKLEQCSKNRASKCLEEIMIGTKKEDWAKMFCKSAKNFTLIIERVNEIESRSKQISTWLDFQRFWDTVEDLSRKAQEQHFIIKQRMEVYIKFIQKILDTLELLTKDVTRKVSGFAPDKVLNDCIPAVEGNVEFRNEQTSPRAVSLSSTTPAGDLNIEAWSGFRWLHDLTILKPSNNSSESTVAFQPNLKEARSKIEQVPTSSTFLVRRRPRVVDVSLPNAISSQNCTLLQSVSSASLNNTLLGGIVPKNLYDRTPSCPEPCFLTPAVPSVICPLPNDCSVIPSSEQITSEKVLKQEETLTQCLPIGHGEGAVPSAFIPQSSSAPVPEVISPQSSSSTKIYMLQSACLARNNAAVLSSQSVCSMPSRNRKRSSLDSTATTQWDISSSSETKKAKTVEASSPVPVEVTSSDVKFTPIHTKSRERKNEVRDDQVKG